MKAKYNLKYSSYSLNASCLMLALMLSFAGCKPGEESRYALDAAQADKLANYIREMNVTPLASKMLLVIPTHGCGPCIDEALKFAAATDKTDRLTILLSGTSKRLRSLLTQKYNIAPGKMLFDVEDRARKYGLITIYPTLFWEDDRAGACLVYLEPENAHEVLARIGLVSATQ